MPFYVIQVIPRDSANRTKMRTVVSFSSCRFFTVLSRFVLVAEMDMLGSSGLRLIF